MTQEELDALMNGDTDLDELDDDVSESSSNEEVSASESEESGENDVSDEEPYNETDPEKYRVDAMHNWPPPPPTDDNKMVHQLDDVTKESEEKATEIFDIIENISNEMMDAEPILEEIKATLIQNEELFQTLCEKFPDIESFKTQHEQTKGALNTADSMVELVQNSGDSIMNVMDIMQYQDIHRQKIERVINVMRALSSYMNTLFSSSVDDKNRVSSAVHLPGDDREDVVDADDIEALLASFGTK